MRRYFPRREVNWLPEEDDTKSQQAEPSGSEQFESRENQQFESSDSQQFEPKQLPVPFVSRAGRAVRPKTSDHNFIYY
ncbi:hypothetical protein DAPPUDRAFT_253261 [Daphnia pulex]|uniref:Uncharacterized protein n=1 Tax=Daphnia pulex TaxID=6669 RepID=E9H4F3_DAPPU|nr:hypothetical protein DAPPUDRAFT_253261 [Daphnia pulex]|eukprot:EFX73411.1 hypothetical protein DAPPUDRAFT_253261 [Daphnia pulex]